MKFKLDENLGLAAARILREPGHDVSTVVDQKLQGAVDQTIYDVCLREQRCLVTLDLDFANVLRFSPEPTAGIVVLRPPGPILVNTLVSLTKQLLAALERENVIGRLWIVEMGRLRIHQSNTLDE